METASHIAHLHLGVFVTFFLEALYSAFCSPVLMTGIVFHMRGKSGIFSAVLGSITLFQVSSMHSNPSFKKWFMYFCNYVFLQFFKVSIAKRNGCFTGRSLVAGFFFSQVVPYCPLSTMRKWKAALFTFLKNCLHFAASF